MKCIAAVLALLLLAGPACADVFDGVVVAAAAADAYTTHQAIGRGGVEMGPTGSEGFHAVIAAGVTAGTIHAGHQLAKGGHRNAAKVVKVGVALLWGFAAYKNSTFKGTK